MAITATDVSAQQRALIMAALGVGSGLLSTVLGADVEIGRIFGYPTLPGFYFGVVLAIGAWLFATRSPLALVVIFVATIVAWVIALQIAIWVNLSLDEITKTGTGLAAGTRAFWIMATSGLCGGLTGGLLTAAAVASVCKDFRRRENFVRAIIIGGVAGLLLVFFDDNKGWAPVALPSHQQLLPLYVVWQAAVAATVGYGLLRR